MQNSKILQAILDGLNQLREDFKRLEKMVDDVDEKLSNKIDSVEEILLARTDKLDQNLTARMDKLGLQIAALEDDAPTNEAFDKLEKRVTKLEKHSFQTA